MTNVTIHSAVMLLAGLLGFGLALATAAGAIYLVRAPLSRVLQQLIGDKAVAEAGTQFVLVLLGLYGLKAALGYITQAQLSLIFRGPLELLTNMAGVIQWVIQIAALLFIGYSLQARRSVAEASEKPQNEG